MKKIKHQCLNLKEQKVLERKKDIDYHRMVKSINISSKFFVREMPNILLKLPSKSIGLFIPRLWNAEFKHIKNDKITIQINKIEKRIISILKETSIIWDQ